jgi:hypothetical protein
MESIKPDTSLHGGPASQPSFNKMNLKEDLPWIVDDLAFPNGTEFRGKYKGYFYYGKVSSGALMLGEKAFLSPCEAAVTITRSSVDGWLFWDCKPPGASSWIDIHTLKQMK